MKRSILRNDDEVANLSDLTETSNAIPRESAACLMVPAFNRDQEVEGILQVTLLCIQIPKRLFDSGHEARLELSIRQN